MKEGELEKATVRNETGKRKREEYKEKQEDDKIIRREQAGGTGNKGGSNVDIKERTKESR